MEALQGALHCNKQTIDSFVSSGFELLTLVGILHNTLKQAGEGNSYTRFFHPFVHSDNTSLKCQKP
jgi:hypothetical protein